MPEEWKVEALHELLPLVKRLGGGLKTKSISSSLLKKGEKRVRQMISTPEILKDEFLQVRKGPRGVEDVRTERGGCTCIFKLHDNPYFCDDNWRQREHDSWESLRDKD